MFGSMLMIKRYWIDGEKKSILNRIRFLPFFFSFFFKGCFEGNRNSSFDRIGNKFLYPEGN